MRLKVNLPHRDGRLSFALIATLALLAVATILLVLFVSASSLDRTASYSYSQSVKADQIGLGGLHLVIGQLQAEMSKDAPVDTAGVSTYAPLFTNVTSANIMPQANVTNTAIPILLKTSNNLPFYIGSQSTGGLQSTPISSSTASINGRSVSTAVWNQTYFGTYPNNASAPNWILMTRGGPSSGASAIYGATTANAVNNPAPGNTNYVLGRIAYAVYDEGQLLDVTAAGYDTNYISPSSPQFSQIKGTLAGADLSQVGITNAAAFVQWRNTVTDASASSYLNYITNFASTNGFLQVYPGDSTFLSRQDLIKAALNGTAGLTTNALPNLTTFTRDVNAPTWAPTLNGSGTSTAYNYSNNALSATRPAPPAPALSTASPATQNPNRFVPNVRYTVAGTVTNYTSAGVLYTHTVSAGDFLVQHRFPLDRLAWVTPFGPSASISTSSPFYSTYYNPAGTATAIKACFGLQWGPVSSSNPDLNWTALSGNVVWQYVGSPAASTTEQQYIETLDQVAAESLPREPNFFELLQAGILSGSLGDYCGADTIRPRDAQLYSTLQLLRIGASMISQVQSSAYPINIEYSQTEYVQGVSQNKQVALVANGVANLPYLNLLQPVSGLNPVDVAGNWSSNMTPGTTQTSGQHYLATYILFGLWNPHQQPTTQPKRPPVRLYIQGQMAVGVRWGYGISADRSTAPFNTYVSTFSGYGPALTNAPNSIWVDLATNTAVPGTGVNGFLNPGLLTASDVMSPAGGTLVGYSNSYSPIASLPNSSRFHTTQTGTPYTDSSLVLDPNTSYAVFDIRCTNGVPFKINLGGTNSDMSTNTGNSAADCTAGSSTPNRTVFTFGYYTPFQTILKYQDANGNWIPYDYWNGVNDPAGWISNDAVYTGNMYSQHDAITNSVSLATMTNAPSLTNTYYIPTLNMDLYDTISPTYGIGWAHCGTELTSDPRSVRFGLWEINRDGVAGAGTLGNGSYMQNDSLWSGASGSGNPSPPGQPPAFPTAAMRNSGVRTPAFAIYGYGIGGPDPIGGPTTGMPNPAAGASTMPYPSSFSTNWCPAFLCRNVAGANATSYPDVDGITRVADSGLFSPPAGTFPTSGNPFVYPAGNSPGNTTSPKQRTADRPIILNRPFNSVGELGYTFRDDPWRTLDFFSVSSASSPAVSTSADSGLLDLFSVTDSTNSIVAGRVNLNTRNANVLAALLNKTVANDPAGDTVDNTAVSTLDYASGLASALTNFTQSTPLVNKDQLVTQFGPNLTSATFNYVDEQNVKPYREAYIRALGDVGQTRTWNLLIDLVAQSGKYPPTANATTGLAGFEVDGERHYWLHVAIDRFTGKILDRQLEQVGP